MERRGYVLWGSSWGFRLVGKLKPCDSCGLIKTKAKPMLTVFAPLKKATKVRDRLFVEMAGPFPFADTCWHKATRNNFFLLRSV